MTEINDSISVRYITITLHPLEMQGDKILSNVILHKACKVTNPKVSNFGDCHSEKARLNTNLFVSLDANLIGDVIKNLWEKWGIKIDF